MSLQITQNRFKQAEFVRNVFHITPEHGAKPEDLLAPEYWMHVARDLKPGSHIEAVPESGEWYAEYYVLSSGTQWAKVALLHKVSFDNSAADPIDEGSKHVVNWGGSVQLWRIVRLADKEVIKSGIASKKEAQTALENYEKALAR